jgi:hypothetical protein
MSLPEISLMSGIQTQIDPDICFTLDSADLGLLDTDILAGTEDTLFVATVESISISRGRSRQFDRFQSGSATIRFRNADRKLDPSNQDSEYFGLIVPRLRFKVLANTTPIYSGFTTDWDIEYDLTGQDVAVASCSDAFTLLSNFIFTADTSTGDETAGPRLNTLLNAFGYQGPRSIDTGNSNLGPYPVPANTQLLDYMFQVSASERGNIFISADNTFTFVARFGRPVLSEVTFADDGTGIPYSSLTNQYGDELLYNEITVSSPAGSVTRRNEDSIAQYGLSIFNFDKALNNSLGELEDIANRMLEEYGKPKLRFTGLSVQLAGLSDAQIEDILALDLADQVSIKKSFSNGFPLSVIQDLIVSGIRHSINPGSHVVEFTFETTPYKVGLVLDDPIRGTIDEDNYLGE